MKLSRVAGHTLDLGLSNIFLYPLTELWLGCSPNIMVGKTSLKSCVNFFRISQKDLIIALAMKLHVKNL